MFPGSIISFLLFAHKTLSNATGDQVFEEGKRKIEP